MIDKFLNRFTTYQVILYWLLGLLALGIFFAGLGWVPVNPVAVLETTLGLVAVTLATNWVFSKVLKVTTNKESTLITALILALVLGPHLLTFGSAPASGSIGSLAVPSATAQPNLAQPDLTAPPTLAPPNLSGPPSLSGPADAGAVTASGWFSGDNQAFIFVLLGGIFAIASKYLLVWRRHHVFNPVALGIVLTGLFFHEYASWWVGKEVLMPFVLVGGLLLARKVNRMRFLGFFGLVFAAFLFAWSLIQGLPLGQIGQSFWFTLVQSEIVFFACAMVTEPLTSPKRIVPQMVFLAVVALLSLPQLAIAGFNFSPELALVVGNVVAFFLGPRGRYTLVLKESRTIAADTLAFAFEKPKNLKFLAGQYLEMTLALDKNDSRGNRRYLSFASSPDEDEVLIAARFPDRPSAFKAKWKSLKPGDTVLAAEISGDFVLHDRPGEKLAFLAGGIGVTPFRSMVKALVDEGRPRDLVILDSHSLAEHQVFGDLFAEAQKTIGAKVVHVLTDPDQAPAGWAGERGRVDAKLLSRVVPDLKDRTFYVSGSPGFVDAVAKALRSLNVSRFRVHTDFFPGY